MALFRSIFWFVLFLLFTFLFTVVFEHGFSDFGANAKTEMVEIQKMFGDKNDKAKVDKDKVGR